MPLQYITDADMAEDLTEKDERFLLEAHRLFDEETTKLAVALSERDLKTQALWSDLFALKVKELMQKRVERLITMAEGNSAREAVLEKAIARATDCAIFLEFIRQNMKQYAVLAGAEIEQILYGARHIDSATLEFIAQDDAHFRKRLAVAVLLKGSPSEMILQRDLKRVAEVQARLIEKAKFHQIIDRLKSEQDEQILGRLDHFDFDSVDLKKAPLESLFE